MLVRLLVLSLVLLLAACATAPPSRAPPFAAKPYEPFVRANAVAVALGEWRLFGSLIDDPALEGWEVGSAL
jgi:starvation-inducible outer membrane lipoprotein